MTKTTVKPRKQYHKICGNCDKKVSYYHRYKPKVCPHCGHEHWSKPKTEVWLFDLQEQYLATRNQEYLGRMYKILCDYAKSFIYKTLSSNVTYTEDKMNEKAHDAANAMIRYYLEKPAFRIDNSFGGYLTWKVKEVLYSNVDEESHESLNDIHEESHKEMIETLELYGYKAILHEDESIKIDTDPVGDISKMIDTISNYLRKNFSPYHTMMVLAGIKQYTAGKSEKVKDNFYRYFGQKVKEHVDITMKEIYLYLQGLKNA